MNIYEHVKPERKLWAAQRINSGSVEYKEGTADMNTGVPRLEYYFTVALNGLLANSAITTHAPNIPGIVKQAWAIAIVSINEAPGA